MGINQRIEAQSLWMKNTIQVLCTTVAFGMGLFFILSFISFIHSFIHFILQFKGIDKPDIRFVIHHSMPLSIEDYYQQSGRAGRDGLYSESVVFFSQRDRRRIELVTHRDSSRESHGFSQPFSESDTYETDRITTISLDSRVCFPLSPPPSDHQIIRSSDRSIHPAREIKDRDRDRELTETEGTTNRSSNRTRWTLFCLSFRPDQSVVGGPFSSTLRRSPPIVRSGAMFALRTESRPEGRDKQDKRDPFFFFFFLWIAVEDGKGIGGGWH